MGPVARGTVGTGCGAEGPPETGGAGRTGTGICGTEGSGVFCWRSTCSGGIGGPGICVCAKAEPAAATIINTPAILTNEKFANERFIS